MIFKGIFVVQLCHNGIWRNITLEGRFPSLKTNGKDELKYGKCLDQYWAPLIEKAMAKITKSYDGLIGGQLTESIYF